mmetsp:Transcript_13519/g.23996  ORF Transcript_13519/g.23996 Transcript_13519/m.23996 type:complete len:244 (+) Transcript_13519:152-883(+)
MPLIYHVTLKREVAEFQVLITTLYSNSTYGTHTANSPACGDVNLSTRNDPAQSTAPPDWLPSDATQVACWPASVHSNSTSPFASRHSSSVAGGGDAVVVVVGGAVVVVVGGGGGVVVVVVGGGAGVVVVVVGGGAGVVVVGGGEGAGAVHVAFSACTGEATLSTLKASVQSRGPASTAPLPLTQVAVCPVAVHRILSLPAPRSHSSDSPSAHSSASDRTTATEEPPLERPIIAVAPAMTGVPS